jgi:hypothetical protein
MFVAFVRAFTASASTRGDGITLKTGVERRGMMSVCCVQGYTSMPKDTKAKKEKAPKAPKEKAPKPSKKGGPKRALSAYMFFAAAKRDEVKAAHPGKMAIRTPFWCCVVALPAFGVGLDVVLCMA